MAVNGGAGNAISFSELRDFYGDTNPVSLSEFNRGGSNVPDTFTGSQTNTQGSTNQTVDDFGVTVSTTQSFTGTMADSVLQNRASNQLGSGNSGTAMTLSYTVLASDALISVGGGGFNNIGGDETQLSAGYTSSGVLSLSAQAQGLVFTGPAHNSGSGFSGALSSSGTSGSIPVGTFTLATTAGTASGGLSVSTARRNSVNLNDVTFQNNSSVSTYTLTSDSTGSETVYSPGESQLVKDDQSTPNWSISYDNVTGSGSGTAGDIGVTVASGSGIAASTTHNGGSGTATVTAPSGVHSYVSVTSSATNPDPEGNTNVTGRIFRNGVQVASSFSTEGSVTPSYTGTIVSGDVFTATGSSGSGVNIITINFKNPDKVITYTNNGSSSLTLGSSSTGGARSLAAGASATVQSTGSTNNQSWAVHFDTSSGNCNTNIPTTIGAGNPINMDLFNAPGTPVG